MKQIFLAAVFWAAALLPTNAQLPLFDLNDPVTLYAVMMFYDNTCGGSPPNAKIALFRWQVTIPAISMAIQLSVVQESTSRFGLQKFCSDFGPIMGRL